MPIRAGAKALGSGRDVAPDREEPPDGVGGLENLNLNGDWAGAAWGNGGVLELGSGGRPWHFGQLSAGPKPRTERGSDCSSWLRFGWMPEFPHDNWCTGSFQFQSPASYVF